VGKPPCASDSVKIFYPKKIRCSSITASGTDFSVTGPSPVMVVSAAGGNCTNDLTDYIVVKFTQPIVRAGTYTLLVQPGVDGSPVFDLCGQPILPQSLSFVTADTVNADFQYASVLGCRTNTVTFSHNGANGVNAWNWVFNNVTASSQTHTIQFPATSTNNISLAVSNGVCRDTASLILIMDNEVKAGFTMDNIICPEDGLAVTNTSTGSINAWNWQYDVLGNSTLENPLPFLFPTINREAYYTVKLTVYNTTLNCADSTRKTLTVLDHCLIEVPTAFTPNNDGLNDTFSPHNALKANNYSFKVFNRWGQLMFESNNWQARWDGRFNGAVQGTGVYVWMLGYTHRDTNQPVFRKGTVTLIK
jgi:gliding motility-associated-like protein